ncbi:MAG: hypothetical protein V7603_6697 [Micromonosporaceae bacterium]|jgi:hypothetical protein
MIVSTPDPDTVRARNLDELYRLGLPVPPANFPLVWEPTDQVGLRPRGEMEARAAILNVVLARCFGMPSQRAMSWLLEAHLLDRLTAPEWHFVASGDGDAHAFSLHIEALATLAWLLSIIKRLDPAGPGGDNLMPLLPDLRAGEPYQAWQSRTLAAPRDPRDGAALLDLYYCLDWAYLEAERQRSQLPGPIDSNAIGQRRWALEWAVVLHGPVHEAPPSWEEVDLST